MGKIRKRKITIRLSEKEYRHLTEQADLVQLGIEPFVRNLIMGIRMTPHPKNEWTEIMRQMSAIGNNINQMAYRANLHGFTDKQALLRMQEEFEKLKEKMEEF